MKRLIYMCVALAALFVACGKLVDVVDDAQVKIVKELQGKYIYERGNVPEDPMPTRIEGYYDIVGGAYRYILNENRPDRENDTNLIHPGDVISFYFDARIYNGSFANSKTYYTNIASRIPLGDNTGVDRNDYWSTEPLVIKIGDDSRILKSLQTALLSCRAGTGGAVSDEVQIYLTPDIAFGDKIVYNVPGNSTLVFEVTDIEIIE